MSLFRFRRHSPSGRRRSLVGRRGSFVLAGLLVFAPAGTASEHRALTVEARESALQQLTDALRAEMDIDAPVMVTLVERNPLVASVGPAQGHQGVFLLSIERGFFETLTDEELAAVVAHELGHVWIYSNHPYLQTEQLANRIALRAVPRQSLERLYEKLWGAGALEGRLSSFLGLPPDVRPARTVPAPPAALVDAGSGTKPR